MYLEKLRLDGRVAVIIGGDQIGGACAQAFGEAGAIVVIAEKVPERLATVVAKLKKLGIVAHGVLLDMSNSKEVDECAAKIAKEHGHVDILVNSAGFNDTHQTLETTDENYRAHMEVNIDGIFWCCRAFGRLMIQQGKGAIVSIGSKCGVVVNKTSPYAPYNVSKAADEVARR